MPIPLLPALGLGLSTAEAIANPLFANATNQRNRRFTREMYDRQRADSLSDWSMQNEYNSPRAQMQRFQEAGLNPNLIYGQMQTAQPVRQSTPSGGQAEAPRVNAGKPFLDIYEMQNRSAQLDLVKQQIENLKKELEVKDVGMIATLKGVGLKDAQITEIMQRVGQKSISFPVDMRTKEANIANIEARTGLTLGQTKRIEDLTPVQKKALEQQMEESKERVKSLIVNRGKTEQERKYIEQRLSHDQTNQKIHQEMLKLWEKGINPNDPLWARTLATMIANWINGRPTGGVHKLNPKDPGYQLWKNNK